MTTDPHAPARKLLCSADLPLVAKEPCPICGSKVHIVAVTCWSEPAAGPRYRTIEEFDYDCETEPDIDSDEWDEWHAGHFSMPYVDWLPWTVRMTEWLNSTYRWESDHAE